MQREERVITNACANYFTPLTFIGLLANFIPRLMILVPVEEQNMCWFYFITKSPFQLDYVTNRLFYASKYFRLLVSVTEIFVMLYQTKKITSQEYVLKQTNFQKESLSITIIWSISVIIEIIIQFLIEYIAPCLFNTVIQHLILGVRIMKNCLTAFVIFYYSIYLVKIEIKQQKRYDEIE